MRQTSWLFVMALAMVAGCKPTPTAPPVASPDAAAPPAVRVAVSIPPQAYLVERLGGSRVQVTTLVSPGQSPHTFEPLPTQVAALGEANVYFTMGLPFENAVVTKVKASRPDLAVVDLRQGVKLLPAAPGEADHGDADPHCWLDPLRAATMAATIRDELSRRDPAGAAAYQTAAATLIAELQALDRELREVLQPVKGHRFLVLHPAFGYFAAAYGLQEVAIEHEGKEPDARQLGQIIDDARRQGCRTVFVQPGYSALPAEAVARELGAQVQTLDPLAADYLANLRQMARALAADGARP